MKTVLFTLFASAMAFANSYNMNCVVPMEGKAPVIKATIEAAEESQADFLMITIVEPKATITYYNQLDKGAIKEGLSQGQLVTMVISETAKMEDGAVRGAGLLVLGAGQQGGYEGFVNVNDTFYPLVCK